MPLQLRSYQEDAIQKLRDGFAQGHRSQLLYLGTGGGKCLGKGTPVLMYDATIKAVEDIKPGDKLASPTGGYRTVLSVTSGKENMYKVIPQKGDSYIVNASHLLSLKVTPFEGRGFLSDGTAVYGNEDHVVVSAEVFYNSSKSARSVLKGWRSGVDEFQSTNEPLLVPPYILGVWLGDGTVGAPHITKPDGPVVDEWKKYGESLGLSCKQEEYANRCSSWRLTNGHAGGKSNPVIEALRLLGVFENKHIPHAYLAASRSDRMELLAGLLDTDGSVSKSGFDWITNNKHLAESMAFLCRSVGLACYISECTKGIKSSGFTGTYWRCSINGECSYIPCRQKKAPRRMQKKRHYVHGIQLESLGDGEYFGFELDGDKLFMLGDFTVTHNTEIAIAMLEAARKKGSRAAMILDRIVLCDQTSKRLDKYSVDHGVLQAGHWRYRPYEPIQVCSAQTLEKRGTFPGLDLLVIDECHAQRRQTIEFIKNNPQIKVVGLSASPFTKGLADTYSNVVSPITTKQLVDQGSLVPLRVFIAKEIDMTGAKKQMGEWSQADATERGIKIVGDVVNEWAKKTREIFGKPEKTIVFAAGVAHGAELASKFQAQGYNFVSLSYKDDEEWKRNVIDDFSKPDSKIIGLIACDILTKGFDNEYVKIGVSARPFSKSFSSHVQQMGRVMRANQSDPLLKPYAVWLDHSGNYIRFKEDWDELFESGVAKLEDGKEKTKKEPTERLKKESKCACCGALWISGNDTCYNCGHVREKINMVMQIEGEMKELTGNITKESKQGFWNQMVWLMRYNGWSKGRASHTYRDKFGVWPKGLNDNSPQMIEPATKRFIDRKMREFLKRKNNGTY